MRRRSYRPPRPWFFDVCFTALFIALVLTAAVLGADIVCREFINQPNGCDWPWVKHEKRDP